MGTTCAGPPGSGPLLGRGTSAGWLRSRRLRRRLAAALAAGRRAAGFAGAADGLHLLALRADDRDGGADLPGLALGDEDLQQDAVVEGLDLEVRLVGLDLGDGLTGGDAVPLLLEPLDDLPLVHRRGERRELDLDGHRQFPSSRYMTFFTAATIRSAETSVAFSSTAA